MERFERAVIVRPKMTAQWFNPLPILLEIKYSVRAISLQGHYSVRSYDVRLSVKTAHLS